MGERRPYMIRIDEDLHDWAQEVSNKTNLAKVDVLDEALRRLQEVSTISEDGQFEIDDLAISSDAEGRDGLSEVIENQREIIEMMEDSCSNSTESVSKINSGGGSESVESSENDNSNFPTVADEADGQLPDVAEAEETIASLTGEMHHDVELDPDVVASIDFVESRVIASSKRYRLPALVAMINHRAEHDPLFVQPIEWGEVKSMITGELGMSVASARNYREDMVREGLIFPHPSEHERIEGVYDEALCKAAGVEHPSDVATGLEDFYPDNTRGFIVWALQQQEWDVGGIYVDEDAWAHDTWMIVRETVERILMTEPNDRRTNKSMTRQERIDGASRVVVELAQLLNDVIERVDAGDIIGCVKDAVSIDSTNNDELEQWQQRWAEAIADAEGAIYGSESDSVDVEVDEAIEVLDGVDEDSSKDKVLDARRKYILNNHPDKSDNDGFGEEYQLVQNLKDALSD